MRPAFPSTAGAWPNHWPTLSGPLEAPKLRVLSLGAGVQSTTLALAASRGDVGPMPDCAIFADTQWEPRKVREHLAWLKTQLRFPVYEVTVGSLRDAAIDPTKRSEKFAVPFFTRMPDGTAGLGRRQCTRNFKIRPIRQKVRELLGVDPRSRLPINSVEHWIGISIDEIERMKPSDVQFIRHRWPLIEAQMSRRDCERWMAERQFTAPKSACRGCPFHSNAQWRDMRDNAPDEWRETCAEDEAIRHLSITPGAQQFMHPSLMPLSQAPIDGDDRQLGFSLECEGMCGV